MLTDAQKVDVRRFCGLPLYGGLPVQAFGWRFFQKYGTLEFRIDNMQPAEETVLLNYLTKLNALEEAIYGTSDNLDTDVAAVWTHNKNEQRDREALYSSFRVKLCDFIGIPPGSGISRGGSIALVV
jgi:hypothetical protein